MSRAIRHHRRPALAAFAALAGILAALVASAPVLAAPAVPAPHWSVESRAAPTNLPLNGGEAMITAIATNVGDAPALGEAETITITDKLPERMEVTGVEAIDADPTRGGVVTTGLECSSAPVNPVQCSYKGSLDEFEYIEVRVRVKSNYEAPAEPVNEVTVSGGGAPGRLPLQKPLKVNGQKTEFGIESYEMTPENENFEPERRPGSHPFQLTTVFELNQTFERWPVARGFETLPSAPALQQNVTFKEPPGLLGDPDAVPQCTGLEFGAQDAEGVNSCPEDTAIGIATVTINDPIVLRYVTYSLPVFNLVPAPGEPARFGFEVAHVPIVLDTSVRTGEDYGVTVTVHYASQAAQVLGARVTLWGAPADPRHDGARGWACFGEGGWVTGFNPRPVCEKSQETNTTAFLSLPTKCDEPMSSTVQGTSWNGPALEAEGRKATLEGEAANVTTLSECVELPFDPLIEAIPESHSASTATALTVKVKLPQQTTLESEKLSEADIKETTVTLPEGMTSNAGAANGLETCHVVQAGFSGMDADTGAALETEISEQHFTPAKATCPEASKIGTVRIKTPVLPKELTGSVYLGYQNTDPFASPLAMYVMAEEEESKVRVKLIGEIVINQTNGQLVSHFRNTPQAPFETLELKLFKAERATQATPNFCGPSPAKAEFVTWSGQTATAESPLEITSGPNGTPCPSGSLPFAPGFEAGVTNTQAGAFSPFSLTIGRPDGQQDLQSIKMTLPPGAAAMLASVTPCPEPQAANAECGHDSWIGESTAIAGLGPAPVSIPGEAFLTGPYKGAPFGILDVTYAHVGPFNLGKIVVRSTITVDPNTAQATVTSDPLPQFVKGAPSQIKELNVLVDRPGFEFNPTNCSQMSVNGTLSGYEAGKAEVSSPFKVGNCGSLPFTPKLTATVDGQGSKANGIGFDVKVTSAGLGQAGIAKTFLTIPNILPSRLTTIQKACLDSVFAVNPASCPEGSVIGIGTIHTPVFKNPLSGPAYLVSHGNAAFPDVEFVLQGENVTIVLDGKTDIKNGVTYSRFESTPDAPFTMFETVLPPGPHSALTANTEFAPTYNVCSQKITMPTEITGQNGAVIKQTTIVEPTGCKPTVVKPKLTRAQLLKKALKACKKLKKKSKRLACEKAARKKYGPKKASKKSKKKTKKH